MGAQIGQNDTQTLTGHYYGSIEGIVVDIDRSYSNALRLTLADVKLDGRSIQGFARISLHGVYDEARAKAGVFFQSTGYLSPPSVALEPDGYNFRRKAWFEGIAAVGYTRVPSLFGSSARESLRDQLLNWRRDMAQALVDKMGGHSGGFAAAIFFGVREFLDPDVVEDMRNTNLAHLLAISGMHIGNVTAICFLLMRRLTSFGRVNIYSLQISSLFAIFAGFVYWGISGASISATRALIMAVSFFVALSLFRRALSLKTISAAALLMLCVEPFVLFDVGFQMSFAATGMLIAFYSRIKFDQVWWPRPLKWSAVLASTSFVAGLATAPFSAFHFHTFPKFGLIANLLAVPAMTFVVTAGAILSVLLLPFGLEDFGLTISKYGIDWIIFVGLTISSWPEPVFNVPAASPMTFYLIGMIGIAILYGGRFFYFFSITMSCIVIALWHDGSRPLLLVADSGRFFGIKYEDFERKFSRSTGHGFAAENWARADGSDYDQEENSLELDEISITNLTQGWRLVFTTTKKGASQITDYCAPKTLILAAQAKGNLGGECVVLNRYDVEAMGGFAANIRNGELVIDPNKTTKQKPWH